MRSNLALSFRTAIALLFAVYGDEVVGIGCFVRRLSSLPPRVDTSAEIRPAGSSFRLPAVVLVRKLARLVSVGSSDPTVTCCERCAFNADKQKVALLFDMMSRW